MEIRNRKAAFDVIGLGSALLDLIVPVDDEDLNRLGLRKGAMMLIDEAQSREILAGLSDKSMHIEPGGSSANTVAGVAGLGGRGLFMGKVGTDEHGAKYISETERAGVKPVISMDEGTTGHAITFITPDSERTFATHLGAAVRFAKDDVDTRQLRRGKILHIEGYLLEPPAPREACMKAMEEAKRAGLLISIDLSDASLIGRIRDVFEQVLKEFADIVFANEDEARAFTGRTPEEAAEHLSRYCDFVAVKIGVEGSIIHTGGRTYRIRAVTTTLVNTNGAGDMYAAGVLYGISNGHGPDMAGIIGSHAAAKVVSQTGARVSGKIEIVPG